MQVAHFLQADVSPWAVPLCSQMFVPSAKRTEFGNAAWRAFLDLKPSVVTAFFAASGLPPELLVTLSPPMHLPSAFQTMYTSKKGMSGLNIRNTALLAPLVTAGSTLSDIRWLRICRCDVGGSDLGAALSAATALESLELSRCSGDYWGRFTLESLAGALRRMQQLSSLRISGFTAVHEVVLAFPSLPALCNVSLPDIMLRHNDINFLGPNLAALPRIQRLALRKNKMAIDDAIKLAHHLACCTNLTSLSLSLSQDYLDLEVTISVSEMFVELAQLPRLRRLALDGGGYADFNEPLAPLTALTALTLLGGTGARCVVAVLGVTPMLARLHVPQLWLGPCGYNYSPSAALNKLAALTRLQSLDLSCMPNGGDPSVQGQIALALRQLTALTALFLEKSALCIDVLRDTLTALQQLRLVDIRGTTVSAEDVQVLAPLARLRNATFVGLVVSTWAPVDNEPAPDSHAPVDSSSDEDYDWGAPDYDDIHDADDGWEDWAADPECDYSDDD